MNDDNENLDVHPGDVIAGKYRVERVLGRGLMGVVVAAMHIELGELRAIKFMSAEALAAPQALERFLREARAAARLKSQHVTKVHDVGRLDSGAPYIVMEYLDGADLRARLKKGGPLSIDEAVLYIAQACEALGEAHEAGIVHRDVKPGNLFLTTGVGGSPCVKVVDFGIAKLVQAAGSARDLTATATVLGTPKYMSPEQMRSDRGAVDGRSDLWALGVTLYNLFTRHMPFTGDSIADLCSAILWNDFAPASSLRSDIPPGLDAVIARCLEKDPARRFQTAADLATALLPFGSHEVQRAAPLVHARALAATIGKTTGTHAAIDPTPLTTVADTALAAATGAPWSSPTAPPPPASHRASWSPGRITAAGLLIAGLTAGWLVLGQLAPRSSQPAAHPPASETATTPPLELPLATPAATVATAAPSVGAAPEAIPVPPDAGTGPTAAGSTPAHADAPHPPGSARAGVRPAVKAARPSTDPFWGTRK